MSYDPVPENSPVTSSPVQKVEPVLVEPLTRAEREELNALSLQAYGRRLEWQKIVRKGEYKDEKTLSSNGNPMQVKRWVPVSLDEVKSKMENVLKTREEQAKKAAEEAALKAQGDNNGQSEENKEEVSSSETATNG